MFIEQKKVFFASKNFHCRKRGNALVVVPMIKTVQNLTQAHPRKSQLERAYETLRDAILTCEIEPEAKIRIAEVCEAYSFSSGSVREALSRLMADGFVVAEPQKGFRAAPISVQDLRELTASRAHIEAICIRLAIEQGDVEWESRVLAAHHALTKIPMRVSDCPEKLNPDWAAKHAEYHAALAEGCANSWMLWIRQMLYQQSERYRQMSLPMGNHSRDVKGEHQAICDAALNRDGDTAEELIRTHLEITAEIIVQGL